MVGQFLLKILQSQILAIDKKVEDKATEAKEMVNALDSKLEAHKEEAEAKYLDKASTISSDEINNL